MLPRVKCAIKKQETALVFSLLLIIVSMFGLAGCAGVVSGSNTSGTPAPPPSALDITNVQAATVSSSTAQIDWTTTVAATSTVDYGTTTSYGLSTPVDSAMVTTHQVTLSGLAAGMTYYYQVSSTDAKSNTGHSGGHTFKTGVGGGTTVPTVSILTPVAGATISGTISVTAGATDSLGVSTVQFKVDGANVGGALTTAPYAYALSTTSLSNGSHTLTAVATDTAGNSATSAAVTVSVNNSTPDTTPPTVSLTAPANGAAVSGIVTVSANASDNVGVASVQFQLDGANLGSLVKASPYSVTWNTATATNGTHSLRAIAKDAAGNSTTSAAVTVTVNNSTRDTTPPTVSLTAPANGASVSGTVTGSANASDNVGVASVQFQLDGANVGVKDLVAPYTFSWDTTKSTNGAHTLRAIATDTSNNSTTSASVTVTVNNSTSDTTPPSIPTGLAASAISASQINLGWNASTDNVSVSGYDIYRSGTKVGTSATNSYSDSGLSALTSYSYTVDAYDAAGNKSAQSSGASTTTLAVQTGGGLPTSLGWYQIPNTKIRSVCPPNTAAYAFSSNCQNVVAAWSGGIADTLRNRMIVWGGGHVDYYGNEVYALDLNSLTMNRLNDPSPLDPNKTCVQALSDGKANTRHTYGGLSYIAHADKMYAFSGIVACQSGGGTNDTWTLDLANLTWKRQDPTTGAPPSLAIALSYSDYDPNTKNVFVDAVTNFFSYNYDTNTYKALNNNQNFISYHGNGVIDPDRKLFIMFLPNDGAGPSGTLVYDISAGSNYQLQDWTSQTSGCSALQNASYPGLAYDPVQKVVVGWAGGDTVYLFNPDTKTCTPVTYPNGPGAAQPNGTNGRFRYFPSLGVFAVVNGVDENAYALRIDPATPQALSISNIAASNVASTSATASWTTNNSADSQVAYGTTSTYGLTTALDSTMVTSHSQNLSSLTPSTTYHYQVISHDAKGNVVKSGDLTFSTSAGTSSTPPIISGVSVSGVTPNSATISWTTDQPSGTQVVYGTTSGYGSSSTLSTSLVTSHTAVLSGLTAATQYHFQAQSQNAAASLGVSGDQTFTTGAGTPPPAPSAGNTITIQDTSGVTQTNRPISVSRAFVQGEIPNYAQASIGGTAVLTQCDVKNRWPDGSVKFAIVSLIVPSLPASGSVTVAFSNQTTGNNTGFLTQSDMLSTSYNFQAQIQEMGTSSHTVSARNMLSNGNFRYWLQGPIVTAVILEDRTSARSYDFNSDGGAGNPLHPLFEAWFYPQTNRVEVGYTMENVWAGSTASSSMRDQTYSFTLTSGQTSPVTHFTQPSFNHIGRSRWYRHFWVGNNAPAAIRIDHNLAYLAQTQLIPNYDTSLVIDPTVIAREFTGWTNGNQTLTGGPNGVGNIPKDMNAGGAADTIGLMTKYETMYLMTMGTDDRMLTMTFGNADLVGRVPFHYREADTNLFFDTGSVNAFGHVVSVNARPFVNLGIGFNSAFNDNCSGANTKTLNLGTVTADGWDTNGMDPSHWPEFDFVAYLMSGKYYYMEEAQFAAAYMEAFSHGCPGSYRDTVAGVLNESQPGRGEAWAFRTVTHGWLASPDNSPEQAYFLDKLENTIAGVEGETGIPNSDPTRLAVWTWAAAFNPDPSGTSPLHFYNAGQPDFIESPLRTDGYLARAWSPWEESYLFSTLGMARDAGLPNVGDILAWGANRWFHLALDTVNVNNIYLIGTYRFPTKLTSTSSWITSYAQYKNAYLGNGGGLPTSWTYYWPCNYAPDDDKRYEGLATLGILYPYTADGFSGKDAWNTVYQSMRNTSGCLPSDYESSSNASPKWAILARVPKN
jgi:hypothetical protein